MAKLAVRVAADVVDAETQFQRPVFQTRGFDQQSGHMTPKLIPTCTKESRAKMWSRPNVRGRKMESDLTDGDSAQRISGEGKFLDDFAANQDVPG